MCIEIILSNILHITHVIEINLWFMCIHLYFLNYLNKLFNKIVL